MRTFDAASRAASPLTRDKSVPDTLERDVSLALAFLIDHQDEWEPTIIAARSCSEFVDGGVVTHGGAVVLPLTLIPQVRS